MSRIAPVLASARQRLLAVRRTGARPPRICGRPPISPCAGQKELSIPPVVPIQERAALRSVGAHSSGAPACEVRGTSQSPGHLGPRRILGHPPVRPPPCAGPGAVCALPRTGTSPHAAGHRPTTRSEVQVPGQGGRLASTVHAAGSPPRFWRGRHRTRYPEAERVRGKHGTAPRTGPSGGDRHRCGGEGSLERRSGSQEGREPHGRRIMERVETAPLSGSYRIGGDPDIKYKGGPEDNPFVVLQAAFELSSAPCPTPSSLPASPLILSTSSPPSCRASRRNIISSIHVTGSLRKSRSPGG